MMTLKNFLALTALSLAFGTVSAQTEEAALPRKVSNVEVLDLEGKPVTLPYWGEKNLMIFYVDPDHHKQNEDSPLNWKRTTVPKATRSTASA